MFAYSVRFLLFSLHTEHISHTKYNLCGRMREEKTLNPTLFSFKGAVAEIKCSILLFTYLLVVNNNKKIN